MNSNKVVAAAAFLGLAVILSGCQSTIKPDGAAKSVTDVVASKTGFRPSDVSCPSGVKAAVGMEFDCHFTGPDGSYVAHVRVTKVDGDDVEFFVDTKRSGQ